MEEVATSLASLVWCLFIRPDYRVTDCAFGVAFQGTGDVLLEGREAVDDAAVL